MNFLVLNIREQHVQLQTVTGHFFLVYSQILETEPQPQHH